MYFYSNYMLASKRVLSVYLTRHSSQNHKSFPIPIGLAYFTYYVCISCIYACMSQARSRIDKASFPSVIFHGDSLIIIIYITWDHPIQNHHEKSNQEGQNNRILILHIIDLMIKLSLWLSGFWRNIQQLIMFYVQICKDQNKI